MEEGSSPERLLWLNCSHIKNPGGPKLLGITPLRLLYDKSNTQSQGDNDQGICPVRLFFERSKTERSSMRHMEEGILPLKLLFERDKYCTPIMLILIGPEKKLLERSKIDAPDTFCGKEPSNRFELKSTNSPETKVNEDGILPCIWF